MGFCPSVRVRCTLSGPKCTLRRVWGSGPGPVYLGNQPYPALLIVLARDFRTLDGLNESIISY